MCVWGSQPPPIRCLCVGLGLCCWGSGLQSCLSDAVRLTGLKKIYQPGSQFRIQLHCQTYSMLSLFGNLMVQNLHQAESLRSRICFECISYLMKHLQSRFSFLFFLLVVVFWGGFEFSFTSLFARLQFSFSLLLLALLLHFTSNKQ